MNYTILRKFSCLYQSALLFIITVEAKDLQYDCHRVQLCHLKAHYSFCLSLFFLLSFSVPSLLLLSLVLLGLLVVVDACLSVCPSVCLVCLSVCL